MLRVLDAGRIGEKRSRAEDDERVFGDIPEEEEEEDEWLEAELAAFCWCCFETRNASSACLLCFRERER